METILKLENIHKSYGRKEVLKGISLEVKKGEIISVLGPSGCGKSTLLNIIAGILDIEEGRVILNGKEISSPRHMVPIAKRDMNMVFQDFALWPHMTARENILYGMKLKKTEPSVMEKKLQETVSLLHLEGLMDQYPSELSGGQQQRVAIARALIMSPSIILLDEPLCNLDVQLRVEMRTEMAQIFHDLHTTVFHVTHDPSEAFAMADRIVVMNQGKIDQIGSPQECFCRPASPVAAGLLGAGNRVHALLKEKKDGYGEYSLCGRTVQACAFADALHQILQFRPEDARFSREEEGNSVPVRILMPSFEGSTYRILAATEDGEEVTFLHGEGIARGETGFLVFNRDKLYAYEQSDN